MTAHDDIAEVRASFEKLRSAGRTSDILKVWCDDGTDALDRVEAELARLREERDQLEARVSVLHAAKDCLLNDLGAAERALTVKENQADACLADAEAAEARCARLQQALAEMESSALKAAQLLPMTLSTSVENDHRDDHASWAGWLLRHKVLPVAREALAGLDTPAEDGMCEHGYMREDAAHPSAGLEHCPVCDTPADSQGCEYHRPLFVNGCRACADSQPEDGT